MKHINYNSFKCFSSQSYNLSPMRLKSTCTNAQGLAAIKGFTLVELMITIAIAGIILTIALPSFNDFLIKMRVDKEVREIQRLLLTTKNTAINSGQNASLCPLKEDSTCNKITDWTGRIGVVSARGLVTEKAAIASGDKLQFTFTDITYNATGQLANDNAGTLSYCPKGNSDLSRGVILTLSGRSMLSTDSNNDGIDEDRQNKKISCKA